MKDKLVRIKNGEVELFTDIVLEYQDSVYSAAVGAAQDQEKAVGYAVSAFRSLYEAIPRYQGEDPEEFVLHALKRGLPRKAAKLLDLRQSESKAPPILLRSTLAKISRVEIRSHKRRRWLPSIAFTLALCLVAAAIIGFSSGAADTRHVLDIDAVTSKQVETTRGLFALRSKPGVISLHGKADGLVCILWCQGTKVATFAAPAAEFITDCDQGEAFVFADKERLVKQNTAGEELAALDLKAEDTVVSASGAFVGVNTQNGSYIIATDAFAVTRSDSSKVLAVNDAGDYLAINGDGKLKICSGENGVELQLEAQEMVAADLSNELDAVVAFVASDQALMVRHFAAQQSKHDWQWRYPIYNPAEVNSHWLMCRQGTVMVATTLAGISGSETFVVTTLNRHTGEQLFKGIANGASTSPGYTLSSNGRLLVGAINASAQQRSGEDTRVHLVLHTQLEVVEDDINTSRSASYCAVEYLGGRYYVYRVYTTIMNFGSTISDIISVTRIQ